MSNLKYQFPEGISVMNLTMQTCKCVCVCARACVCTCVCVCVCVCVKSKNIAKKIPLRFHLTFWSRMVAFVKAALFVLVAFITFCYDKHDRNVSNQAAMFSVAFYFVLVPLFGLCQGSPFCSCCLYYLLLR
jgi:hypothetical protein